jgi:uncharacterized protein (TIGR03083 family)
VIEPLVDLVAAWRSIEELAASLTPSEWHEPTGCPGWDVQDVIAHILDIETQLLDGDAADITQTDAGVAALRDLAPTALLDRLRAAVAQRQAQLEPLTDEDLAAPTPTPLGPAPVADALAMRTMDVWVHEQDIRRAIGRPGHDTGPVVEGAVAYLSRFLGYVVGRRAGAPDGATINFEIGAQTIGVAVTGRRGANVEPVAEPTVTLTMDAPTFSALAGGRADAPLDGVGIAGDVELGRRIVDVLGFMP